MNAMPAHSTEDSIGSGPYYFLRQKNSERFWNGSEWTDAQNAKSLFTLDIVFSTARRLQGALDLMVLFPSSTGRLVIPLAQMN